MGFDSVPVLPKKYLNWIFEPSSTDLEIFFDSNFAQLLVIAISTRMCEIKKQMF
jgi:hypothetical protein